MTQREQLLSIMARLGINQSGLSKKFEIPKKTLGNWMADPSSKGYREAPPWALAMLEALAAKKGDEQLCVS